jgi:hypothetical protein
MPIDQDALEHARAAWTFRGQPRFGAISTP